jgi:hypothetical protein
MFGTEPLSRAGQRRQQAAHAVGPCRIGRIEGSPRNRTSRSRAWISPLANWPKIDRPPPPQRSRSTWHPRILAILADRASPASSPDRWVWVWTARHHERRHPGDSNHDCLSHSGRDVLSKRVTTRHLGAASPHLPVEKSRMRSSVLLLVFLSLVSCFAEPRRFSLVDEPLDGPAPGRPAAVDGPAASPVSTPERPMSTPDPRDGPAPAPQPATPATSCPDGFHLCGNRCSDNSSPESCNVSCTSCPAPIGGSSTCDGKKCGVACPPGHRACQDSCIPDEDPCEGGCTDGKNLCNGLCVAPTSLSACGSSCSPCPSSPDGVAACDGDKCELTCNPGYHRCDDACLSDASPLSCGTSCTPCVAPTGGKATCEGGKCGAECPSGTKLCSGACIPIETPCPANCPPGRRDCLGTCVVLNDVNFCGTSCNSCASRENADVKCANDACAYTCRTGYHMCDDRCRDNRSVDSCGDRCTRCPAPANATPTCDGVNCSFTCNPGTYQCGAVCIARDQPCNGVCRTGFKLCGRTCVEGNCCTSDECGPCKSCQSNKCQNTTDGQGGPGCAGTCRECQGGSCRDRANSKACGASCVASTACCTNGREGCPTSDHQCIDAQCILSCTPPSRACGQSCILPTQACNGDNCPPGFIPCGGGCVQGDCCSDASCGPCKNCVNNRCATANEGQKDNGCSGTCQLCQSGTCVNRANGGNFQECGSTCLPSSACCTNGQPGCPPDQACTNRTCNLSCVDPSRKCGNRCIPPTEPCNGGCPAGRVNCNGICVQGNCCPGQNCGTCSTCTNNRCTPTTDGRTGPNCSGTCQICQGGACVNRPGSKVCGSACVPNSTCCPECRGCSTCDARTGTCSQPITCPQCQTCNATRTGCTGTSGGRCTTSTGMAGTCNNGNCMANITCPNGRLDPGETCDPCNTRCRDDEENESNPTGSATNCTFQCNTRPVQCRLDRRDGKCPSSRCGPGQDLDCCDLDCGICGQTCVVDNGVAVCAVRGPAELCGDGPFGGNGKDDNCNGFVDEGCCGGPGQLCCADFKCNSDGLNCGPFYTKPNGTPGNSTNRCLPCGVAQGQCCGSVCNSGLICTGPDGGGNPRIGGNCCEMFFNRFGQQCGCCRPFNTDEECRRICDLP